MDVPSSSMKLIEKVKGFKENKFMEWRVSFPVELKEKFPPSWKTLQILSQLNITQALNNFAQVLNSASSKAGDHSVPSVGQADTRPTEGEKDTNQATISQLFQRRANKNAVNDNLNKNKPQTETTPPPNPLVITTTITQMQSPSLQPPPKIPSQCEGEHIKEDKGKKALSSKETKKESTDTDSNDETHVTDSMKLEEDAKAKAVKQKGEVRKAELVDLLSLDVVKKYYNDKLQYDKYCDKMLNRRAVSRITNCDVLTRKGSITLKVYREDGTSEIIPNFKASDLHLGEWREVMKACPNRTGKGWETIYKQICTRMVYIHTTEAELGINLDIPLSKQDPLDKLNDLANKKIKHDDDIHDYFKANKRLKSSVQYKDYLPGIVLNELVLGMILLHQGPVLDDDARTFSSLLLAEIDNLNPLKQMRVIDQLRR
ncbi:hypothetical protein Tco_1144024 [Tanacetum coccineum]